MKKPACRQTLWYWAAVGLITLAGAAAFCRPADDQLAISKASPPVNDATDPTVQDRAEQFRAFREEVAQLEPAQQAEVWQSMRERTDSLAEQTLYEFFALDATPRLEVLDRTIDRIQFRQQMQFGRGFGYGRFRDGPRLDHAFPSREVSGDALWNQPFEQLSLEDRLASRRELWEDATQQALAMRIEFARLTSERRKERGIPEPVRRGV